MSKKEEPLKFEDALDRLEKIVDSIDDDNKSLEEAIELYEEGISLAQSCSKKLEDAKLRVEEVNKDQDRQDS